jgi:hypothetical protein
LLDQPGLLVGGQGSSAPELLVGGLPLRHSAVIGTGLSDQRKFWSIQAGYTSTLPWRSGSTSNLDDPFGSAAALAR